MKRLSPNNCSVVVFQNGENELASTLQLLYKVFSDGKKNNTHTQNIACQNFNFYFIHKSM